MPDLPVIDEKRLDDVASRTEFMKRVIARHAMDSNRV
jgi:hypothetical protein